MAQSIIQSGEDNFGDAATATVTLNSTVAGNYLEVRGFTWGNNDSPALTITDNGGANVDPWALAGRSALVDDGNNCNAEVHYAYIVTGGNYTVTATHAAASPNRYGWIRVLEISGRKSTSPQIAAVTGTANSGGAGTTTPAVTAAGATGAVNCMVVGVLAVSTASTNIGIDAAAGSSLTWTNRIVKQDGLNEMAGSADDAPSTTNITPTVNWGTLASAEEWAAVIVAFEDAPPAAGGGGPLTNGLVNPALAKGRLLA